MTPEDLRRDTAAVLGDSAAARWLVETATGIDDWARDRDMAVTERMVAHLDAMVARYRTGEPLQYVLGHWGFRHLDLSIDRRVLIPRPETEALVDLAREILEHRQPRRVADLGCGSGAIGLALAAELPLDDTVVVLSDIDPAAIDVARANLAGIGRPARNVQIVSGHWCEPLHQLDPFDVIVSNPPYIAVDDPELDHSVRDYEPSIALFGGDDGLDAYRAIVADAPTCLTPDGWLIVEIGRSQGAAVQSLCEMHGFVDVEVLVDIAGHDRFVRGRYPVG